MSEFNELAKALVEVQKEMEPAKKNANNPFFKSKYAELSEVLPQALSILNKHGLTIMQMTDFEDGFDILKTIIMHSSGQMVEGKMRLHLIKNDPQAHGSAITYARRYALMAAIGMVADEDDDGNKASEVGARKFNKPALEGKPTEKQINLIRGLCQRLGYEKGKTSARLASLTTKEQASEAIEILNEKIAEMEAKEG